MSGSGYWTDERTETLKALWAKGHSGSQIVKEMHGVTRGAVLGKIWRMGLSRPAVAAPRKIRAPVVKRAPNTNAGLAFVSLSRRAVTVDPGLDLTHHSAALPGSSPRPWTERAFGECTWPIGEGASLLSCCNPVHARGWCKQHFERGTTPAKTPKAKVEAPDRRWAA